MELFEIEKNVILKRETWKKKILFFQLSCYKNFFIFQSYTKPKGQLPDYESPVILNNKFTVEDFCNKIHRQLMADFKEYSFFAG